MLAPKRAKYRKSFRGKRGGKAVRGSEISFGAYGLKALTVGWVGSRQIEAARRALTHYIRRGGRVWIRIFPDKPITKKPPETRMGSGKGEVYEYVAVVKPGRIMFEMGGVEKDQAKEAMRLAGAKLPIRTRFVQKD
ncbi:50S ribosomal protein L16 [Candidatus Gottesmanbacteria bacterium RIFCSPLOWO2_01_FULL_49_10]|uniref:Large ribosomal subunit protein uL16 n=1 Tax=Candidatus Gottesmanbacteria bacterium RIFCSPLOWO2_01_FULL_49_10 TaxID=1798396 RepID=A0A1F6AXE4_9BACT|nr:MAG: 50S ribosomal protein L16 [Candidatus Gottesmanbacteria bacterium RIFCSPLOWO2_01_FULL_49_10]